jgi:glycosyltransferase involved in cell wall biosynthesis
MRVLVYWEQDSWGGVDSHLLELLSTWPQGHDEFVLMVNTGNAGFQRMKDQFQALLHVKCVEVSSYSHNELNRRCRGNGFLRPFAKLLHFVQPISYWFAIRSLQKHFQRQGTFDLLLADNGGYPAAWGTVCAIEAAARLGVRARIMLVHHAAISASPFMGVFERYVDGRMNRLLSAFVCVSNATRQMLLQHRWIDAARVPLRVIHNGMQRNQVVNTENALDIRKTIGAGPEIRLVGMVGRVASYKGHEDVIFALARLTDQLRQKIRLVVVGPGVEPGDIENLRRKAVSLKVHGQVDFMGYVEGRAVDVIAQLDLLVVATRSFEGFGLTLMEAISVGVPVLASTVGAIPEFVTAAVGALVPPNNPAAIAAALAEFIEQPQIWSDRAQRAQEAFNRSTVDMASEYRQLFVECLS